MLSPFLFAIYTDGLLKELQESGIGCHMGHRFSRALAYADDITLLSPSRSGMAILACCGTSSFSVSRNHFSLVLIIRSNNFTIQLVRLMGL